MGLFKRKPPSRSDLMAKAGRARARGRKKKAIAIYRRLLVGTPDDVDIHAKLAPLLAARKQRREAAKSFNLAAESYISKGFDVKAIAVYKHAVRYFPTETGLWLNIARLQIGRHNKAEAVTTLLNGSAHFRKPPLRSREAKLLKAILSVSPWHPYATIALAKNMLKTSKMNEAIVLLRGLEKRTKGKYLRRARWALFRTQATPANLWRWVRSLIIGR
ncbi:MAG: hypothetical protein RQ824_07340 [bacterium]|nr:hypothetical protein [bacterium]